MLTTAARVSLAYLVPGFVGGDDVEMLEVGFRSATGLEYQPNHLRNLLLPELLVAPAVRTASALGFDDPGTLVVAGRLPFVALATLNVLLLFRLGRHAGLGGGGALAAAALYGLHWLPLGYGATTYPRTAAVTCVLAATILVLRDADATGRWRPVAAGACLAFAFACRYSELIFLPPLVLLAALGTRSRRSRITRAVLVSLGFALGALVTVGVVDWLTWGRPFSSLEAFFRYIFVERASSSRVAAREPWWYLQAIPFWLPLTLVPLLARVVRRHWVGVWAIVLLPVLGLSAIYHKELRYLQGVLPFVMVLAAAGFLHLAERRRRALAIALAAVSVAWGLAGLRFLTRTSGAAVCAARIVAADEAGGPVVLSQSWAYGGRLLFGNEREVRDIATPPSAAELAAALPGARWVGVYASDLEARPELASALLGAGFVKDRTMSWWRGRRVQLWRLQPSS